LSTAAQTCNSFKTKRKPIKITNCESKRLPKERTVFLSHSLHAETSSSGLAFAN